LGLVAFSVLEGSMQKSSLSAQLKLRNFAVAVVVFGSTGSAAYANSVSTIWGNSATAGPPIIQEWDFSGNLLDTITAPLGSNGRGVVQVGDILYYTSSSTNGVYAYNSATHTDLGTAFTVSGASGLATMAYDGTNFWIGDYSGTNKAYEYSPTGTLLSTITLQNCTGYCDGLEYANGNLISNRSDGGNIYDVYDTSGNLLTSAFITDATGQTTGIAFDGTNYYVSTLFGQTIDVYDASGNYLHDITLQTGGYPTLVEDLSVNYVAVLNPTPLPGALPLFASGLGALGLLGWRRKRKAVAALAA
jgi:hypothetical protein